MIHIRLRLIPETAAVVKEIYDVSLGSMKQRNDMVINTIEMDVKVKGIP